MAWPSAAEWGMAATVFVAYTVFGLTGFGSAMVSVPILVQFLPLRAAVPLVLLLDLVSTVALGVRQWRKVSGREMLRLLPFMVAGIAVGVGVLTGAPAGPLLAVLGVFVIANASWNLLARGGRAPVRAAWAVPAGFVGGIFSALFGTGGPVYVTYLAGRVTDASVLRATIATVILASALMRLAAFAGAGLYDTRLLLTALALLPFCALGVWTGNRLHDRVPAAQARRILHVLLACSGVSVLVRAMAAL